MDEYEPGDSDSILYSVKKMLGIGKSDKSFDIDIITHINAALSTLTQFGVGPEDGFFIVDETDSYRSFLDDPSKYKMVNLYLFYKTKLLFDPPIGNLIIQTMKEAIKELEWRLNLDVEHENEKLSKSEELIDE